MKRVISTSNLDPGEETSSVAPLVLSESQHSWLKTELARSAGISAALKSSGFDKRVGNHLVTFGATRKSRVAASLLQELVTRGITDIFFLGSWDAGGANKVARNIARSLASQDAGAKVVFVITGAINDSAISSEFEGDVFFLRDSVSSFSESEIQRIIYLICTSLPSLKRTYNFNSSEQAKVIENYSKLLRTSAKVYLALFCEDYNALRRDISFGARFYMRLYDKVDGIISDNKAYELRVQRQKRSDVTRLASPQWFAFYQPWTVALRDTRKRDPEGPILWAGRFTDQKNWKLLVKIAKAMPETQFVVFGFGDESTTAKLRKAAKNLRVEKPYTSPEEVLKFQPGMFLHTSKWDGIPNTLLEFGALGLPIVTSVAGSISELIGHSNERAIGVEKYTRAAPFVAAVNHIRQNETMARQMAEKMQEHLLGIHARDRFDAQVVAKLLSDQRD